MISARKAASSVRVRVHVHILFLLMLVFIPSVYSQTLPEEESASAPESTDQTPVAEESLPAASPELDDEDLFNDESFFFEAPALIIEAAPIEIRPLNKVFPNLSQNQRIRVRGDVGLRYAYEKGGEPTLIPDPDSGVDLLSKVMAKNPSHIIEALVVLPYSKNKKELDLIDIYNALGRVKNIKDHKIIANDREIIIFSDTTRLESAKERKPIPDPAPTNILPYSETIYLRFIDPYIGDFYLREDMTVSLYGLTYNITNFRDVSYFIFRVMKSERFSVIIYLEPIKEGILIYSVAGLYLPNFIAKRVNLTPNMNRRITVLLSWIIEGLRIQEDTPKDTHFYKLKPSPSNRNPSE